MAVVVPRDRPIASLPRRMAAGAIDVVCMLAAVAAAGAAMMGVVWVRRRPGSFAELVDQFPQYDAGNGPAGRALSGAGDALMLVDRNLRSPGMRAMGLRRVDAVSGGPVTLRSAVVRSLLGSARSLLGFHLFAAPRLRRVKRWTAEVDDRRAEMRQGPEDERTDEQLLYELMQRDELPEKPSCLPAAFPLILQWTIGLTVMLRSPRRQTLSQRAAGTVVIHER
jgi:hypothetical protein